jgi:hypothetical protein
MLDWSALLIRGKELLTLNQAGLGYTLFAAAMTCGRLAGDWVTAKNWRPQDIDSRRPHRRRWIRRAAYSAGRGRGIRRLPPDRPGCIQHCPGVLSARRIADCHAPRTRGSGDHHGWLRGSPARPGADWLRGCFGRATYLFLDPRRTGMSCAADGTSSYWKRKSLKLGRVIRFRRAESPRRSLLMSSRT